MAHNERTIRCILGQDFPLVLGSLQMRMRGLSWFMPDVVRVFVFGFHMNIQLWVPPP